MSDNYQSVPFEPVKKLACIDQDELVAMRAENERLKALVEHWRHIESVNYQALFKEKQYAHLNRRLAAMTKKLRNVRAAAMDYKRGQDFDKFMELHNERAAKEAEIERLEKEIGDLLEIMADNQAVVDRANSLGLSPTLPLAIDPLAKEIELLQAKITAALALTDTESPEFKEAFGRIEREGNASSVGVPGWRVVDKVREILNGT